MKSLFLQVSLLGAMVFIPFAIGSAQGWEAPRMAAGWAKQDKDDSFTFYDAGARILRTWTQDAGELRAVPLLKLEAAPERWVIDPRNNAWVAHGTALSHVDATGRVLTTVKLPAEVGDVCWDPKGFVLSYRTPEPYLEKRDYKNADVIWSFGPKPGKREGMALAVRRPVLTDDAGHVVLADGRSLDLITLDETSGRMVRLTNLTLAGSPAPPLEGDAADRGPLALWPGKGVVFAALKASQLPAAQRGAFRGLVLARLDPQQGTLEFLPTGLAEDHLLVGVLDSDAVFANPRGGLLLVRVK